MNGQAIHRWHKACPIPVSSLTVPGPAPATSETFANLNLALRNVPETSNGLRAPGVDRTPQTAAAAQMHGKAVSDGPRTTSTDGEKSRVPFEQGRRSLNHCHNRLN